VPELAWRRVRRIEDVVRVGDRVGVEVVDVDTHRRRGVPVLARDGARPLRGLDRAGGRVVVGKVTKIAAIGAFVRIEDRSDGFEGLLPGTDLDGNLLSSRAARGRATACR